MYRCWRLLRLLLPGLQLGIASTPRSAFARFGRLPEESLKGLAYVYGCSPISGVSTFVFRRFVGHSTHIASRGSAVRTVSVVVTNLQILMLSVHIGDGLISLFQGAKAGFKRGRQEVHVGRSHHLPDKKTPEPGSRGHTRVGHTDHMRRRTPGTFTTNLSPTSRRRRGVWLLFY
jgi:hypothetical protein